MSCFVLRLAIKVFSLLALFVVSLKYWLSGQGGVKVVVRLQ